MKKGNKLFHLVKAFVNAKHGQWNHEDWLSFLAQARENDIMIPEEELGNALEQEKQEYLRRASEHKLSKSKKIRLCRRFVSTTQGRWTSDDWLKFYEQFKQYDNAPADEIGAIIERERDKMLSRKKAAPALPAQIKKVGGFLTRVNSGERKIHELKSQIFVLQRELTLAKNAVGKHEKEEKVLLSKNKFLSDLAESLKEGMEKKKAEGQDLAVLRKEIELLKEKLRLKDTRITDLGVQILELKKEKKAAEAALSSAHADSERLKAHEGESAGKILELREQEKLAGLKIKELSAQAVSLDRLKATIQSQHKQIDAMKAEVDEKNKYLSEMKKEMHWLEMGNQQDIMDIARDRDSLRKLKEEIMQKREELGKDAIETKKKLAEAQKIEADLAARGKALEAQAVKLEEEKRLASLRFEEARKREAAADEKAREFQKKESEIILIREKAVLMEKETALKGREAQKILEQAKGKLEYLNAREKQIEEQAARNVSVRDSLAKRERELKIIDQDLSQREAKMAGMSASLTRKEKMLLRSELLLEKRMKSLQAWEDKKAKASASIKDDKLSVDKKKRELAIRLQAIEKEYSRMRMEKDSISQIREEIAAERKGLEAMKRKLAEKESGVKGLEAQLAKRDELLKRKASELHTHYSKKRDELETKEDVLEKQIRLVKSRIIDYNRSLDALKQKEGRMLEEKKDMLSRYRKIMEQAHTAPQKKAGGKDGRR